MEPLLNEATSRTNFLLAFKFREKAGSDVNLTWALGVKKFSSFRAMISSMSKHIDNEKHRKAARVSFSVSKNAILGCANYQLVCTFHPIKRTRVSNTSSQIDVISTAVKSLNDCSRNHEKQKIQYANDIQLCDEV